MCGMAKDHQPKWVGDGLPLVQTDGLTQKLLMMRHSQYNEKCYDSHFLIMKLLMLRGVKAGRAEAHSV